MPGAERRQRPGGTGVYMEKASEVVQPGHCGPFMGARGCTLHHRLDPLGHSLRGGGTPAVRLRTAKPHRLSP